MSGSVVLARLVDEARSALLSREFLRGELRYAPEDLQVWTEPVPEPVDLAPVRDLVREVVRTTEAGSAAADVAAAPRLRKVLPISRRLAADPGVWRFVAVAVAADLVRHRWPVRTLAATRQRFWRAGVRHDSNAIGRLWWIAELTRDGDDFSLATRVLGNANLATTLFARRLGWHRPVVEGFVRFFSRPGAPSVEATVPRFSAAVGTCLLDALGAEDVVALLERIARRPSGGAGR